jgi:hypothetical protein
MGANFGDLNNELDICQREVELKVNFSSNLNGLLPMLRCSASWLLLLLL